MCKLQHKSCRLARRYVIINREIALKTILLMLLLIGSNITFACKERMELEEYPIEELSSEDILVEAKISKLESVKEGWYSSIKSFDAEVITSFQGNLKIGEVIRVTPAKEEAHAVCPVYLKLNSSYLLVIKKLGSNYEISRFNYRANEESPNFEKLKEQIRFSLSSKNT
jgi:hypothetical protein